MTMKRIDIIKTRLEQSLQPSFLEVIDESDQHIGHAGHQGGERHFAVRISAPSLEKLSRVEAHRKIYALFNDLMPHQIHALKISVLS